MTDDLPSVLRQRLANLPPAATTVLARLGPDFAPAVWIVGGAVRDMLMGGAPLDLDLVVEGPLEPVLERLGEPLRGHDRFGTGTLALGGASVDLARSRREVYARPGALPDVEPATLEDDLHRRDFTVNAVALGLTGPRRGELHAVAGALEDIAAGVLRVLHDGSFRDDPTRLLRMARYAGRLGLGIAERTTTLATEAIDSGALATVSPSRIGNELRLLAREDDPLAGFAALRAIGADEALEPGFGVRDPAAVARALELIGSDGRRDLVVLAGALLEVRSQRRGELLGSLAFNAAERQAILEAAGRPRQLAHRLAAARRPSEIAAAIGGSGAETVALAGGLGAAAAARQWLEELRHKRLEITGDDLLAAGVSSGRAVGRGLRAARAAALDGLARGREEQLAVALDAAAGEEAGGR